MFMELEIISIGNKKASSMTNLYPKKKIVGFYRASNPQLIIRCPEIIKQVLTTDFNYFYARGFQLKNVPVEPLLKNLFTIDGDT